MDKFNNDELHSMKIEVENKKVYLNKVFNRSVKKIKQDNSLNERTKTIEILNSEMKRNLELQKFILVRINKYYNTKGYEDDEYLDDNIVSVIIYLSIQLNKVVMKNWEVKSKLFNLGEFKEQNLNFSGKKFF